MKFFIPLLRWALLISAVLLSACGSWPMSAPELPPLNQTVSFGNVWKEGGSAGLGKVQMKLYPNFVMYQGQQWLAVPDDDGQLIVLDPFTGKRIWRTKTDCPFSSAAGETDEAIVMGCSNGQVIALKKSTGEVMWTAQVSSEVLAAPRGDAQALVVLSIDSRLHGLDAKTGKKLWIYEATAPALTLRGAADPLIVQDMAFVGFSNGQVGLFKLSNGQVLWLHPAAAPRGKNEIERMVDIDGVIERVDNMAYVVTYHGQLVAIDLPKLEVVWSHPMSSYVGLTTSLNDVIVSDADDTIYAIDRMTGETRWKQDALKGRDITAPGVYDHYVVVGDATGYLFAFSLFDGQLLGYQNTGDDILAPVLVDPQGVIIQNHNGRIQKFNIVPKE